MYKLTIRRPCRAFHLSCTSPGAPQCVDVSACDICWLLSSNLQVRNTECHKPGSLPFIPQNMSDKSRQTSLYIVGFLWELEIALFSQSKILESLTDWQNARMSRA